MIERVGNARIRATRKGRFVLNEIVRQISASFEAAPSVSGSDPSH